MSEPKKVITNATPPPLGTIEEWELLSLGISTIFHRLKKKRVTSVKTKLEMKIADPNLKDSVRLICIISFVFEFVTS